MKDYNILNDLIAQYRASGLEQEIDHNKFYLYSIVTHSTAIEGSTMSEVENQLLFDEGITPMGKSLTEQLMLVDAREAEDEGIFIDKMLDLLCQDIRKHMQMCNATDNSNSVTENDLSVTDTQRSILAILHEQPEISQSEIAQRIGIHRVNVNRNIQQLVHRGMLRREGSDRKGRWIIL